MALFRIVLFISVALLGRFTQAAPPLKPVPVPKAELAPCKQTIDVVFVQDGSGSIDATEWKIGQKFLRNTTATLDSTFKASTPNRFGLVQFSTTVRTEFELMSGVDDIINKIMAVGQLGGNTQLTDGITGAIKMLNVAGRPGTPWLVVVVTDGEPTPPDSGEKAIATAQAAKANGTRFMTIGVGLGPVGTDLLRKVASTPEYALDVTSFPDLPLLLRKIVSQACVSVASLSKTCGKLNGGDNITISGTNLFNFGVKLMKCRFTFPKGEVVLIDATYINSGTIRCMSPKASYPGVVKLEVTPDGHGYTNDGLTFTYVNDPNDCVLIEPVSGAGFYLLGLAVPILLLIPLFSGLLCVVPPPIAPPSAYEPLAAEAPSAAAPAFDPEAKYKHKVKSNAYIWQTSGGGAAPMKVDWGNYAPPSAPVGHDQRDTWQPSAARAQERSPDRDAWARAREESTGKNPCCDGCAVM